MENLRIQLNIINFVFNSFPEISVSRTIVFKFYSSPGNYCGFRWNANTDIQNPTNDQLRFFAAVNHNYGAANKPWKTETNKMDQNLPITIDRRDLLTWFKWAPVSRAVY